MQTKTTIRFFTIADYEKEQEYIFALLFGILICLYLLVCKNICKLLNNRMHAPRTFYCHELREPATTAASPVKSTLFTMHRETVHIIIL